MPNITFSPPPGLFTDDTDFSSDGKWVDGSNVRFWNGKPQPIGGWVRRMSTQITGSTYKSAILEWKSNAGTAYVAYGPVNALKVETGGALFDVTPTGTFTTAQWVFQPWGETLLACVSGAKLYQWSLNTGVIAAEITQSPDIITTILVTPERQCLALGCNEEVSGTFNSRCIRGCDLEDLTDWTSTTTNNAFEHILDGASSGIVTARMVGDYVAIWTSNDLFMGQFVGDPSQTYSFQRIGTNCGVIGRRAVQIVGSTAFWVSPDLQIYAWTPGGLPAPIKCDVIDYFRTDMETASKVDAFASYVEKFNEVWFHYTKTSGGLYRGRFIAFNVQTGKWFKGETRRRAMHQGLSAVIAVDNGGNLLTCESGQFGSAAATGTLDWSLESGDYYLSKAQTRMMLRSVWPDFEAQAGNVSLVIKTSEYPQGAEVSQTALTLTTNTTKKDFRVSGRLVRVTFSGTDGAADTATFARFGQLVFDAVPTGQR